MENDNRKRKDIKMKRTLLVLVVAIVGFCTLCAATAPSFTVETFDGKIVRSATLLETGPIFLDFWSTGCAPCLKALPHINEFTTRFPNLNVVVVSTDPPRLKDKSQRYIKTNKFDFIAGYDGNKDLQRMFNVSSIPRTFIIDVNGEIVYDHASYNPGDEEEYIAQLRALFEASE